MKLIAVETQDGPAHINPRNVETVKREAGGTTLTFTSGKEIWVAMNTDALVIQISINN